MKQKVVREGPVTSPRIRWIAPAGHRSKLSEVLELLSESSLLVAEGAVFVNRKRAATADQPIAGSDTVEIFAVNTPTQRCTLLDRRGDLLVVDKPPELASEPTRQGAQSAVRQLSEEIGSEVHIASRLDVGVGGLLLASTTTEGNRHLARLRESGGLCREYLALAAGGPKAPQGRWRSTQRKGRRTVRSETRYSVVASTGGAPGAVPVATLLWLEPVTGRTHQLRRHAAEAGAPLFGDRRYLGQLRVTQHNGTVLELERIMLHAVRVTLEDQTGALWQVVAPLPREIFELWDLLSPRGARAPRFAVSPTELYQALLDANCS
jgi:23S rRNA-/tRNA-specific pseudouridylate synthase